MATRVPNGFPGRDGPWLALDASTYRGTVAVLRGDEVLAARATAMRGEREERLLPAVVDALAEAGVAPSELRAIACGAGPGSFTSLRIAASIAKGLAHAARVPLYAMPSLALLAASHVHDDGRYLVATDALRGDVYAALITLRDGAFSDHQSLGVVSAATLDAEAVERGARVVRGTDAVAADARRAALLVPMIDAVGPVDLDAWEPDYGRKAEAQVKWEAAHGRALPDAPAPVAA